MTEVEPLPTDPTSLSFAGTWEHCTGWISSGNEIAGYSGVLLTPKAAEAECQRLSSCIGYTYKGNRDANYPVSVWLKQKWDCTQASGWHSFKKPPGGLPPVSFATLSVEFPLICVLRAGGQTPYPPEMAGRSCRRSLWHRRSAC